MDEFDRSHIKNILADMHAKRARVEGREGHQARSLGPTLPLPTKDKNNGRTDS